MGVHMLHRPGIRIDVLRAHVLVGELATGVLSGLAPRPGVAPTDPTLATRNHPRHQLPPASYSFASPQQAGQEQQEQQELRISVQAGKKLRRSLC